MASENNNNNLTTEDRIVQTLERDGEIPDTGAWAEKLGLKHDDKLVGSLKSLEALGIVLARVIEKQVILLSEEAEGILQHGSAEVRTFQAIPAEGIDRDALEKLVGAEVMKIGWGQGMKAGYFVLDKATKKVTRKVDSVTDSTKDQLSQIKTAPKTVDANVISQLQKRKLVAASVVKHFHVTKAAGFTLQWNKKQQTDLTTEMLTNGAWKGETFKGYNFNTLGVPTTGGHLHPLLKVRTQFRELFLEMGFEEMPTNNFVESSFWNFDTLFQPQQHPARDAHDTFFLSDPAEAHHFPQDYLERVKTMHSTGGHGSKGWRYDWKESEARKNILRTHTTAVSSRMLYKLSQDGFKPKKYFSIDRVFRNEALDATHLAEFHQIEGLIADYDLTLGNLVGVLTQFFERLGIKKLRFKPAYNPYTEPSMEVFSYHEGLKRWVEIGNSGVFRPEMLLPMGLPPNVRVIAWGLSLERPTMIKYGISNIRELIGHKINLEFIRKNPICRLDE